MGYAGVISLKQTIQRLLDSCKFSVESSTREILGFAYKEATSLQEVLKKLDDGGGGGGGKRLSSLDWQIREAVQKLEDFLELHQSDLFLDEDHGPPTLLIDSERVRQEISWFAERGKKLGEDYVAESEEEDDDDDAAATASSSNTDFGVEMVGFSDELTRMEWHVTSAVRPDDWGVLSIVGPAGTGRSYVAKRVFDDVGSCRELSFDRGVWVTVGPNYQCEKILELLLTQILIIDNGGGGGGAGSAIMLAGGEEMAKRCLWSRLVGRRYMIVLDDVCDTHILDYLASVFPVQNNGSVVLVTTGAMGVALYVKPFCVYRMDDVHINYEDMHWDVFRWVLFRLRPVPPELEEAGRKIVRNCRGLLMCMSKVLLFLWSADRTPQAWNQIARDRHHPVFQVVDELAEIRKIKEDLANLTIEPASDKAILSPFVEDHGISRDIEFIKKKLFPERFFPKMEVISFVGMAGIGKTTFVKKIFEYLQNLHHFDQCVCVWVTLGPKYQSEDILIDILAQIYPDIDKMEIKGDTELANDLSRQLSNKRFLIVLDDVWNEAPLLNLAKLFPNIKGRALVTTRLAKVAQSKNIDGVREMRLLYKEESWDLLRQKVFGEGGLCPYELEKPGKKIAENCDGLPLTVVKVANLLSKDLSPQYWNDLANQNSDFTNALKEISKALLPCYESLPHYLKPCFLYMGVFPQNYEVSTSKVHKFWIAEGFLEPDLSQRVEDFAAQCLLELVNRSLVMVCHKGTSSHGVKTCRLNSVLWHLSDSEAMKNKFFHTYAYDSIEGIKNQRRFCIRNCILLSLKDIHDSMMDSVATARSLVCTGSYHQYQLPVCFELRLLRVLDTRVIRFYEFPIEVVKLIHLRHLAITCDGNLPTSISKLWNLQFLIVSRHLRIKSFGDCSSYLPMEIWDMKELRHLQVTDCSLPTPSCGTILPNLVTLLDVSSHSCVEEVLKAIPNLEKLGIQIELPPGDAPSFHYLNHISDSLSKLESLKCVVMNPEVGFAVVAPPPPHSMFPSSLEKLSLSGLGYPWEYMNKIGELENLKVLKLRCYAFQGEKWETGDSAFKKLTHLVIEDTNLECWKTTIFSFSKLKHLSIKHCYNFEELPHSFVRNEMIEVVDCNPFAVKWAKQMKERNGFRPIPMAMETVLKTRVESSWDVGEPQFERKTSYERYISRVDLS